MQKTLLALACALVTTGAAALELAPYPKVFSGPEGVEVVLAPSTDGKEALMRISGVNHPIDKVVFLGQLQRWGGSTDAFVTTIDGRDSGLVQKLASPYGGGERYVAYVPGRKGALELSFSENKSKALKPADLKASYDRQQQQGVQQKLARFDREKQLAYSREQLAEIDKDASTSCGAPVNTTVDWAAIGDEQLKTLSVHSYCGAVASGLGSLCRDTSAGFKPRAAALGQITCQFGSELKARVEGGKLVFTTAESAPNQDDFIRQFLRNQ